MMRRYQRQMSREGAEPSILPNGVPRQQQQPLTSDLPITYQQGLALKTNGTPKFRRVVRSKKREPLLLFGKRGDVVVRRVTRFLYPTNVGQCVAVGGQLAVMAALVWLARRWLGISSSSSSFGPATNNWERSSASQRHHPVSATKTKSTTKTITTTTITTTSTLSQPLALLFGQKVASVGYYDKVMEPVPLDVIELDEARYVDYGGIHVRIFAEEGMRRVIYKLDSEENRAMHREVEQNDVDYYYNFDDDRERNPVIGWGNGMELQEEIKCRRTSWHRRLPINCNNMHEFDFLSRVMEGRTQFMGAGSYRQVYLVEYPEQPVAFKEYYWGASYDFRDFEFMRMDALVMEIFSSDPKIVSAFAFCGLGILNEGFRNGDIEHRAQPIQRNRRVEIKLDDKDDVNPLNGLTPTQKLTYALEMAEALAALHAYIGGVIVHDDVHLGQFLVTDDGHLKLHDFNRAEIMLWNDKEREYCRYRNNPGHGEWRAPEEFKDKPLNEKIDVWSLGMNIYALLTGLLPFYDLIGDTDDLTERVQEKISNGDKPPIDSRYKERSFAERKLVEIVEMCWEYDADKRIDMFHVAEILRSAVAENKKLSQKE